jgi:hypothetical protein
MKTFLNEAGQFFGNLWGTLKALAASRKAVLAGLAIVVAAGGQLFPQYADALSKVAPTIDTVLMALAGLIALEDGLSAGKGSGPSAGAG